MQLPILHHVPIKHHSSQDLLYLELPSKPDSNKSRETFNQLQNSHIQSETLHSFNPENLVPPIHGGGTDSNPPNNYSSLGGSYIEVNSDERISPEPNCEALYFKDERD
ncbi:hypothetical protein HWI79_1635 [Cryptosporidium felis]|nr:hypothetical protein HWI79_1635 [Cryptosporidium felis]